MNYAVISDSLIVGSQPQTPGDIDHLKNEENVAYILCLQQDKDIEYWGIDFPAILSRCKELGIQHIRRPVSLFIHWAYTIFICLIFFWIPDIVKKTKSVSFIVLSTYEVCRTFKSFALLRKLTIAWFAGSWLWPRFLEVTIANGSFRIRMGYIAVQRAGLCPLHCRTWEGSSSRNCIHVLVRGYGCKFVSSPYMHTVVEN